MVSVFPDLASTEMHDKIEWQFKILTYPHKTKLCTQFIEHGSIAEREMAEVFESRTDCIAGRSEELETFMVGDVCSCSSRYKALNI